ncbi:hypothetical protein, partial [Enterobacter sp. EC_64]
ENTDDLFIGKTLLHGDVLMWLMKTLLTSGCTNQRGAGQIVFQGLPIKCCDGAESVVFQGFTVKGSDGAESVVFQGFTIKRRDGPQSIIFQGLAIKGRDSPESIVFYSYAHKYSPVIHLFSTLPSKIKQWFL